MNPLILKERLKKRNSFMVKIIIGLICLLIILFSPVGYNVITGRTGYIPLLKTPQYQGDCVEGTIYMRKRHMEVLERWRNAYVRDGIKRYVSINGIYNISLTGTCLKCHSNKAEFCDRCHDYGGIKPGCWDCHHIPEIKAEK